MKDSPVIPKNPVLAPALDYAQLRRDGLGYLEDLCPSWTDFNIHDPGLTILELLAYAITDIAYRTTFELRDLLTPPAPQVFDGARQGFFTARQILTVNPWSERDIRKLLIDVEGVKNGWISVREAPCDSPRIYVDCARGVLGSSPATDTELQIRGLYDVWVELEDEDGAGDLNSGKIYSRLSFATAGGAYATATLELRLPSFQDLEQDPGYDAFLGPASALRPKTGPTDKPVRVLFISGNAEDAADVPALDRPAALRRLLFVTLIIDVLPNAADPTTAQSFTFAKVPLRVWFERASDRKSLDWSTLAAALEDATASGPLGKYHRLTMNAGKVMSDVKRRLHGARNLCEDFCSITAVAVQDIAVCADLEVAPAADIEGVLGQAYYAIEQYFSPDLRFYTLQERIDQGRPVDEIFEGPALDHGFLDDDEVDSTRLKTVLHTSDLIERLMSIPGLLSVKQLRLSKFDAAGHQLGPSEPWELAVSPGCEPRFYEAASKFLVFKNGLPFLPDRAELDDVLQLVKGRNARPKLALSDSDLPVPSGVYRDVSNYFPIQYQLPLTYGVGYEGLPAAAGTARLAQARQLRAYLSVFEQLFLNYLAQLGHASEYFAIDSAVTQTTFSSPLSNAHVRGIETEILSGLGSVELQSLVECPEAFLERRNRFLDRQLARFAESFSDYALMLYRFEDDQQLALTKQELIDDKLAFLQDLPRMSCDRARAFDYTSPAGPCHGGDNAARIALRIRRVLGLRPPDDEVLVIEHLLLRPRTISDRLLPICPASECGDVDPYSFRLTVVMNGESGFANRSIERRRFSEATIRAEAPAHLDIKVCWVSASQLQSFRPLHCAWLDELAKPKPDPVQLGVKLNQLLEAFAKLKSVYPPAYLHDCVDGNDENRVYLNQTVISSVPRSEG